ncbi:cell cycle RNA binding protein whi3 [Aspergillus nanangensis]|uniref:Cell cycle RNA binding protein whi3 n=1 Tax=Aspergillus nanangensis TaxID=2582783 RepID=A0AAD4CWG5_ASPNN|nr:cell cycle RNA binding protein whi3 [Aspergillus nanangensis]
MSGSSNQSTRTSPGSYSTAQRTPSVSSGASPPHQSLASTQAPSAAQNAMSTDLYNLSASQAPSSLAPSFTHPFAFDGVTPTAMRPADSDRAAQSLNGLVRAGSGGAILIQNLPTSMSREALRSMLLFAKDLVDVDFEPVGRQDQNGYLSAVARFSTMTAAHEACGLLNGKQTSDKNPAMIVVMYESHSATPLGAPRRNTVDHSLLGGLQSNGHMSRMSSRFNGTFQSMEKMTAANPPSLSTSDVLPSSETGSRLHTLFSPQSPIGNGLPRVSGKSMIDEDIDEETGELLKDPVGYAENGHSGSVSASARRSTNPQFPTSQFGNLSLSTNIASPPLPNYTPGGSAQSHLGLPTPSSAYPPSANSTMVPPNPVTMYGNPHAHRHSLPAANPNDMNPPCNTLYVGNLPPDAVEEELKALFVKSRGYKRLCFRNKQNGPMCFVEFEDVGNAGKALNELYGYRLSNSAKTGIRLSFSKNPLGVRSSQPNASNAAMSSQNAVAGGSSLGGIHNHAFSAANGPPPGLTPPGLGLPLRNNGPMVQPGHHHAHMAANGSFNPNSGLGIRNPMNSVMSPTPPLNGGGGGGPQGSNVGGYNTYFPDYMMGR